MNPMIDPRTLRFLGTGLARPECVLAGANGRLYASDWRGGVSVLEPDGSQWSVLAGDAGFELRPNGIALLPDGAFLVCHLGEASGGVFRLEAGGELRPFLLEVDGMALPPTNYAHLDHAGRTWITVSTRLVPRARGYRADHADGFIVLVDERGARIVADALGYTNECQVHPDGRRLFVNETFSRRLTAFDIGVDGSLSNRRTAAEFGDGTFPDGLAFDTDGDAWITSIVSNRVIRVRADGRQDVILEDSDPVHLATVESAYREGRMDRPHLDRTVSERLRNVSSLAFGGADLRTAYLGCLLGDNIACMPAPVAGFPPTHWRFDGPERPSTPAHDEK